MRLVRIHTLSIKMICAYQWADMPFRSFPMFQTWGIVNVNKEIWENHEYRKICRNRRFCTIFARFFFRKMWHNFAEVYDSLIYFVSLHSPSVIFSEIVEILHFQWSFSKKWHKLLRLKSRNLQVFMCKSFGLKLQMYFFYKCNVWLCTPLLIHSWYLLQLPQPVVLYFFQGDALFCIENAKFWGLKSTVVSQNWQISGMCWSLPSQAAL